MPNRIRRVFVEKRDNFKVEADHLLSDLTHNLNIDGVSDVRIINCYECTGFDDATFDLAKANVFSEPNIDEVYEDPSRFTGCDFVFRMGLLPGQFDQRADSAMQCVQLLTAGERPLIRASKVIAVNGSLSDADKAKIKTHMINVVESCELDLELPETIEMDAVVPEDVAVFEGFTEFSEAELASFKDAEGFAMSMGDILSCQAYFKGTEKRNPTITEMKAIDTYWSDHCRHTTFMTEIEEVKIREGKYAEEIQKAYDLYRQDRAACGAKKPECLMDLACIAAKSLKNDGYLKDIDVSEEINACSINVDVDVDGSEEKVPYLVMFKNETHNHPTEIEPFGGAATCLGGAIRDPLSGRSYVYQAMRITGAADPRTPFEETLPGKLPQRTICKRAAHGYSSYGNQIGVTTGFVKEYYNDRFVAKRMEVGAVIAATPKDQVIREVPEPGDIVILVGGRTGRDGCGGATGSSKEHTEESLATCGAEVQKGNAPEERKIQRLFRNETVSKMIIRCNDFGAGGVSVAVGELADSIDIYLDRVPKKYDGLDGTELAISESQERMAVVVRRENAEEFIRLAGDENLEATAIADITDTGRLRIQWRGNWIIDVSRAFLDTNGVSQSTKIEVESPEAGASVFESDKSGDDAALWMETLSDLNVASQKGLVELFDSTIGAGSALMPHGGKTYRTPTEGMAAKIPVEHGDTSTGTLMAHGYNPEMAIWSPFHGGLYAVVESVAKVVAMGGVYRNIYLSLQEYFEKLRGEAVRWGKPFAALLGAYRAQKEFKIGAIGGKDSMSGSFKDLDVPPTLISFAVAATDLNRLITPEFKREGSRVVMIRANRNDADVIDFDDLKEKYDRITRLMDEGHIISAHTVSKGGAMAAISKMCFGNTLGMEITPEVTREILTEEAIGSLVLEVSSEKELAELFTSAYVDLGMVTGESTISHGEMTLALDDLITAWEAPLNDIFEIKEDHHGPIETLSHTAKTVHVANTRVARPKVIIPAFPGTNCELDTQRAFERAGADAEVVVFKNLTAAWVEESIATLAGKIKGAQIIALPGGFSAGDEPEGSGKFIASIFKNEQVKDAVHGLLNDRDGLMLGICNGFQALVKLGLLPFGEIRTLSETAPTLTYNKIGRHVARYAKTRVASNLSPWLAGTEVGEVFESPLSHGEGRFFANEEVLDGLIKGGQIATQYVDEAGNATYDGSYNPNGSIYAIEGITSADGRILGKMGHSERIGNHVAGNIYGKTDMKIFESGVRYFQ
ncbi:phosphoribosylformylglycinamidine synthase [Desulfoluna butyratoxydans]|uniref:Phosphoribosylformylglycinamidine synthase fgam n=1 Tax=Desulfoluna butyratoxydans TaxID=231438 RepID=A0A4U8YGX4_9BACT|nr:phosphoribosylformylglycinamidine synthase [Desulfoluna butyratoxydans]VFQ42751.1 phosphoribosylformylglycinamidine synthase fgam [Desulfoluna butyratoxydans]